MSAVSVVVSAISIAATIVVHSPLLSMASAIATETETEFQEFPKFAAMARLLAFPIEFLGLSPFLVFSWVSLVVGWLDELILVSHKMSAARLGARPISSHKMLDARLGARPMSSHKMLNARLGGRPMSS